MTGTGPEDSESTDHAYFEAIEGIFVGLRGSPLLLSPADWQVARCWHREGIPLDLVKRTLEEVFAKRQERGVRGKISSLRYCASAVEAAWEELRDLTAPGHRASAPAFEPAPRLAALAAALPARVRDFAVRVTALDGDPRVIEERLSVLDHEMLDFAAGTLDAAARAEIAAAVEKTLASLAGRLTGDELERSRERLSRQILRQRLGMPVLSLFSPEAEPPDVPT